jgi:beta-galactosidase/beta-glucuronidase
MSPQKGTKSAKALVTSLCFLCFLVATVAATAQTRRLDQGWQLLVDREANLKIADAGKAQGWRQVQVGLSWNAQFPDLRDYMGVAWYRTQIQQPALSNGNRLMLEFGAVDYFSEVFVNGKRVGEHEGGYTPFTFDITDALKAGANELVVRVRRWTRKRTALAFPK